MHGDQPDNDLFIHLEDLFGGEVSLAGRVS